MDKLLLLQERSSIFFSELLLEVVHYGSCYRDTSNEGICERANRRFPLRRSSPMFLIDLSVSFPDASIVNAEVQ